MTVLRLNDASVYKGTEKTPLSPRRPLIGSLQDYTWTR